jgi:hypothetical protein
MSNTNIELEQWLAIRKEAARHINAETAEVFWEYGQIADPYGLYPEVAKEHDCIGRLYFARSPGSDIWVCFYDLPEATVKALWERMERERLGREGANSSRAEALIDRVAKTSLQPAIPAAEIVEAVRQMSEVLIRVYGFDVHKRNAFEMLVYDSILFMLPDDGGTPQSPAK